VASNGLQVDTLIVSSTLCCIRASRIYAKPPVSALNSTGLVIIKVCGLSLSLNIPALQVTRLASASLQRIVGGGSTTLN
jgi:hypothetical protein